MYFKVYMNPLVMIVYYLRNSKQVLCDHEFYFVMSARYVKLLHIFFLTMMVLLLDVKLA